MRLVHIGGIASGLLLAGLAACSGSKSDTPAVQATPEVAVEQPADSLRDAVTRHDTKSIKAMADELALNADDLSPDRAVSVLMGFYDMHLRYSAEGRARSNMETMRKFVDVYDIVNSNHGAAFRKALSATGEMYPDVDFQEVYGQFADKLAQYDGATLSDVPSRPDTVTEAESDTVTSSGYLPPELRPAE